MEFMANKGIAVESSLTSNVQTSTVFDYPSHPIKTFLRFGIPATINTDDPGISNITLQGEFNFAAIEAGLNSEEIFQTQKNALEHAFLSREEKEELVSKKKEKNCSLRKANFDY
jgi:adenosine deaminase